MDILKDIKEKYWINVYISDNPKAPVCSLEFVDRNDKTKSCRYPVWKDREKPQFGYVGNLDVRQGNSSEKPNSSTVANNAIVDDLNDEIPFAFMLPFIAPLGALMMMGV